MADPERGPDVRAGRAAGQPHHAVREVGQRHRQRDRRRGRCAPSPARPRRARAARPWPRSPARTARRAVPASAGSSICSDAVVDELAPRREHGLPEPGPRPARPAARSGRRARRRRACPSRSSSPTAAAGVWVNRSASISTAERVQHPAVGQHAAGVQRRAELAAAALPVEVAAGALRVRRDREHHVGQLGDRRRVQLQADQEPDLAQRGERRRPGRPGRSGRPRRRPARPDRRTRRRPGSRGVAARRGRQRARGQPPGPLDLGAGRGVGDRAAAGQQRRHGAGVERAAVTGPARDPADRRAGARGQRGRPRSTGRATSAARSPTRITASARGQRVDDRAAGGAELGQHRGLGAGHRRAAVSRAGLARGARRVRDQLPRWKYPLPVLAGTPCAAAGRRCGASSSGSSATHSTAGAASSASVARPACSGLGPDDVRGQEVQLLVRVRAGPEVDVVGAGRDPGELGVGVGVLDGQPAAGAARRCRSPPARPAGPRPPRVSASVQDASASSPSAPRTIGRVIRPARAEVAEREAGLVVRSTPR